MPQPTIESRMTGVGSRHVRPVMEVINRTAPSHVDFAADGAIVGQPVDLSRGRPLVEFQPGKGTIEKPGAATRPEDVLPNMKGSTVEMGFGFYTGFMSAWEAMEAEREALNAARDTATDGEVTAATSSLLQIILKAAIHGEGRAANVATEKAFGSPSAPRYRIEAWTRR